MFAFHLLLFIHIGDENPQLFSMSNFNKEKGRFRGEQNGQTKRRLDSLVERRNI
jgi:hypothetical protein